MTNPDPSSPRGDRLRELFDQLAELAPNERARIIDQLRSDDPGLAAEVASMLAALDDADGILEPYPLIGGLSETPADSSVTGTSGRHPTGTHARSAVAQYRIGERLGGGAMGVVFRAEDVKLGRTVALKFLHPHLNQSADAKARFVREARAASALDHPNICTIHDIGETDDGELFIVMAHYPGRTLASVIAGGKLSHADAMQIAARLASALERAHEAGIVHRDVKPGNVMITDRGGIKLLDFGIARLSGADELTRDGATVGTVAYMSPEQVEGKDIDTGTDVWALGVVTFEMLTGRKPFGGANDAAVISAILHGDPPDLTGVDAALPRPIIDGVCAALTRDRRARPRSIAELRASFGGFLDEPVAVHRPEPADAISPTRHRGALLVASFASLIVVGAALAFWLVGQRSQPAERPDTFAISPFTRHAGHESSPVFSADGTEVAYAWDGGDRRNVDIYIQRVDGEAPRRLTDDPAADAFPAWSPDGRTVAFLRMRGDSARVMLKSALGGTEQEVARILVGTGWKRIVWHPSGDWLVVSDRTEFARPARLSSVSISTGAVTPMTFPPDTTVGYGDAPASFAANGNALVFIRRYSYDAFALYAARVRTWPLAIDQPRRVGTIPGGELLYDAATVPGTSTLLYSSGQALWSISINDSGGEGRPVANVNGIREFDVHPIDGRVVYREEEQLQRDLMQLSIPDGEPGRLHSPRPVIASSAVDWNARFSADGSRIVFESTRGAAGLLSDIWTGNPDGTDLVRVTAFETSGSAGTPAFSPDGSHIVYDTRIEGNAELYIVRSEGGEPSNLTNHPSDDIIPDWSSDGQWIYFNSRRSGEQQVWKIRSDGSEPIQVTYGGGGAPQDSRDGSTIYYSKHIADLNTGTGVWRIPAGGGEEEMIIERVNDWASFAVGDDGIYFIPPAESDGAQRIDYFHFADRSVQTVFRSEREITTPALSPDGRTILYSVESQARSDLYFVGPVELGR